MRRPRTLIQHRRVLAAVASVAVVASALTVPATALAADGGQEDRVYLEPAVADASDTGKQAAEVAGAVQARAQEPTHPPIARAKRIDDVRSLMTCRGDSDRSWVLLSGPGDLQVAGWSQCRGTTWTFRAMAGVGHIGGMTLRPRDFSGTLTIDRTGRTTGSVAARLPWSGSVLPEGKANARLILLPVGGRLVGEVVVRDTSSAGTLTMTGPVADTGRFTLSVKGTVDFAGAEVPMTGTYRSGSNGVRGRGFKPTWVIRGAAKDARIPGVVFVGPRLVMSSAQEGINGQAQARLAQADITAPVTLSVIGSTRWRATFDGSSAGTIRDDRLAGLSLLADDISGSIVVAGKRQIWKVSMPMRLIDGKLALRGTAELSGPQSMRVTPRAGLGDLFGTSRPVVFTKAMGSATFSGRKVTGRMAVLTPGEQLVDMPTGWTSATVLELTPRFRGPGSATLDRSIRYLMTKGLSRVVLAGGLPASGPFRLTASGYLGLERTKIPVRGGYVGSGPRPSTAPGRLILRADTGDAPRGRAVLAPGVWMTDTVITYSTVPQSRATTTARAASLPKVDYSISGSTVTLDVTTSSGDNITLSGTAKKQDGQYVITVSGSGNDTWEPYEGLSIPVDTISGTIYADDDASVNAWELETGEVSWAIANGIVLNTTLSLSSECPLEENCPEEGSSDDSGSFYVGGSSTVTGIPSVAGVTIPDLEATGAFLADGSWVRWDGTTSDAVTIEGPADSTISMNNATVTIFSGERDDTIANLEMPDLSSVPGSNGVNVQVCGTFEVTILDFDTGEQEGCVGSTEVGKVLGQVKVGGTVSPTDSHEGLTLNASNPPTLSGFAWSDIDPKSAGLSAAPVMGLYGQALSLVPKKNSLTADVVVPASLMESLGTGINTDTSFVSTGWFETNGNFFLDLDIPVNLKASGVTLQNIDLSIGRTKEAEAGSAFDFALDATGEAAVSGHHYPFDALIELKKDNTNNEAAVSLSVIGETSSQSIGTFDDASYLPQGDFEPAQATLVDGNFDDSLPANDFSDGGFEAGSYSANLITDPSFEDSASFNLLPKEQSTFNGDISGNTLPNADFEEFDVLYNGDFEGVDGVDTSVGDGPLGWDFVTASKLGFDYSDSDPGPSGQGTTVFCPKNSSSSSESYANGFRQMTRPGVVNGGTYKLTGWVRGNSSTTNQRVLVSFQDEKSHLSGSKTFTIGNGSWNSFEVTGTASGTDANSVVSVYLTAGKSSNVCFDDITFERTSGNSSDLVGSVKGPDYVEMFDTSVDSWGLSKSGGIQQKSLGGANYALKTDGCDDYWTFADGSRGDLVDGKVPWDMSVNIYLSADSKEERANVGFLLSGSGKNASGYFLRLKNAGSSDDGGFYSVKDGTVKGFGGGMNNLTKSTWYNVRLVGWGGSKLYAQVTNLVTNSVAYSKYVTLTDIGRTDGVFGQYPDSRCEKDGDKSWGSYWDNFQLRTGSSGTGVILDASQAHSGVGVALVDAANSGWSGYTSVGEPITSGRTYSYSAWVKSKSGGTVSGKVSMKGVSSNWSSTNETIATRSISVGSSWTQVRLTWTADRDYSDAAVGFTGMSSGGDILVDDQTFQQIPYERYIANNGTAPIADVVPSPDDVTDNVLLYQPLDSNSSALYYWVGKPFSTTVYHLSANIRSVSGTQKGSIQIYDGDGSSRIMDFTATTTETTIGPLDLTSKGGSSDLRIAFNLPGGASGIYIDDVVLTATETTSGQTSGTLGVLPPVGGWISGAPTSAKVTLVNQKQHAHSGDAYMRISPNQWVYRAIPVNAIQGQTYTASVWLKAPNGDLKTFVELVGYQGGKPTANYVDKDSVPVNSAGYTEVTLTLPIKQDGIDELWLIIWNETSDKNLAVDDVSVSLAGLSLIDPWKVTGNTGLVAMDDSVNAHFGGDYLAVTGDNGSSIRIEPSVKATTSARTFTAWVRSPSGSMPGTLSLAQSDGGTASVDFTADTTWRPVRITLTGVNTSAAKTFTSKITLKSKGTLWVDDLVTSDVKPFLPTSKDVTVAVTNQSGAASSLPNGLLVSAKSGQGVSALITLSKAVSTGTSYTVSANIRAVSGTATGTIGLDFGSQAGVYSSQQTNTGSSTSFTADDTWQQFTATFTAPSGSFTSLTPKFTLSGSAGGSIYLDNVTVNPSRIELDQPWTPYWDSSGQSVDWGVWDDPANAHDGSLGVMSFTGKGAGTTGMITTFDQSAKAGEVYSATVWARTETSKTADLKLEFRAQGNTDESAEELVQLTDQWQLINVRLPLARSHSQMRFSVFTKTPGVKIYIDDASVVSNRWSTNDNSTRTNVVTNPSLEKDTAGWTNRNDSQIVRSGDRGYVGGYSGELIRPEGSATDDYIVYDLAGKIQAGQTYTVSAYVWLPEDAAITDIYQGRDFMWAVDYGTGGVTSGVKPDFSKPLQWQRISTTIKAGSDPKMNVRFYVPTGNGWFIDGLVVEQGSTASAYFEGTVPTTELSVVGDGPGAYEGTGYAQLSTVNASGATMSTPASTSEGAISGTQHYTVYVRSLTGELLDVEASLSGSCTTSVRSRVVGSDWTKLETTCEIRNSSTLTMGVTLHTPGGVLAVDSVRLSNEPEKMFSPGYVYGVTSPLEHPQSGYRYLWDDAFGVPGLHLWGFSVQLSVDDGEPGLGVQATVYQDPTAIPKLFDGEDWIKGDAVINISEIEPCFDFGFASVSSTGEDLGDSGISIANGALEAEDFHVSFAPRGCAVGEYTVPAGTSISFDALVGSGTLHFDLGLSRDDEGEPEFTGDLHVTELNIGGVDYRDLEMSVDVTPIDSSVTYLADMQLPLGGFKGSFDMTGGSSGVHVDGAVQLTDWGWKSSSGKGFTINVFNFDMAMDVGTDNCGSFVANADAGATANFASASNLAFAGHFAAECGDITEFQIVFDYVHGSITEKFYLDYEDESETLAGGVAFEFQRKTSWKYLTHRYHRTARIAVAVDFVMDVANPSGSEATIDAEIKIANGSGKADCGFGATGQPGDYCNIDITVQSDWLGKHEWSETW